MWYKAPESDLNLSHRPASIEMCGIGVLRCILIALMCSSCRAADCPGIDGHLNVENIANYEGCSRVMGNIVINEVSFQSDPAMGLDESLTVDRLSVLSEVREVDGYVQVENTNHEDLTNLRFLHNLETIHGHETLEVFPAQQYSLVISGNSHLQTLNLASLKRIENGGVRITSNPQLCLVDTISIEDYLTGSGSHRVGGYAQDCSGVTCHDQCEMSMGCWGTLADECVQCRSYHYQGICVEACNESISYTDDETTSCIPLPTSPSDTITTDVGGGPAGGPEPSPTYSMTGNNSLGTDANRTVITQVQSAVTATPWLKAGAMNTSLSEIPIIIAYTSSVLLLITLVIIALTVFPIIIYKCIKKRKKSNLLKEGDKSNIRIQDTQVIQVGVDERASPLMLNGQGTLNRRQHVCARVASDHQVYNGQHDAASPEPEVVVMVDNVMESSCDDVRYTSMPFECGHVTPPSSCDNHVTASANPLYDTIDPQPFYNSIPCTTQSTAQPQKQNPNPTFNTRSQSQIQNSGSPFQRSLMMGAVYPTRTTTSLQSTSSRSHTYPPLTTHSHRSSLTSSGAGISQRTSARGSRMSQHRLSTAGGSVVSSSRAGTSTQGSMNSGIMPMQE